MASESSNQFGWKLLGILTKKDGNANVFLSPLSISVALAMTHLGAKGETAEEMEKALCWKDNKEVIHKEFQEYFELLQKPTDNNIIQIANRIYIEDGYAVLDEFLQKNKTFYLTESVSAPFKKAPDSARQEINSWVEKQTQSKIKDLIPQGALDSLTRMVLVNAIYFKGKWETPFASDRTQPGPFYKSPNEELKVAMMSMETDLSYYEDEGFSAVELPYQGGRFSLCVFLPTERFGLEALAEKLTMEMIYKVLSHFRTCYKKEVNIVMPRFEISSSFDLNDCLMQSGMVKAFSEEDADFSGMTGSRDLCISNVVHKAFLKVNEEGSEAAAATGVLMALMCATIPYNFIADHPFLVVIHDKKKDMILFLGKVTNPSG